MKSRKNICIPILESRTYYYYVFWNLGVNSTETGTGLLSNKLLFHRTGRKRLPSSILDYLENSHDVLVRQQRRGKTPTKELSTATKKLNLLLSLNLQEDQKRFPILPTWQFLCIPLYQVSLFNLVWMAMVFYERLICIQNYHLYTYISKLWMHHLWKLPKKENYLYLECSCYTLLFPTSPVYRKIF